MFVLVREDQNEMGFVDAAVLGVFATQENAHAAQRVDEAAARRVGLRSATVFGWEPLRARTVPGLGSLPCRATMGPARGT